jgi:hypothetical protein
MPHSRSATRPEPFDDLDVTPCEGCRFADRCRDDEMARNHASKRARACAYRGNGTDPLHG